MSAIDSWAMRLSRRISCLSLLLFLISMTTDSNRDNQIRIVQTKSPITSPYFTRATTKCPNVDTNCTPTTGVIPPVDQVAKSKPQVDHPRRLKKLQRLKTGRQSLLTRSIWSTKSRQITALSHSDNNNSSSRSSSNNNSSNNSNNEFHRCVKLGGRQHADVGSAKQVRKGRDIGVQKDSTRHANGDVIRAGVLLPFDKDHLWSLPRLKWSIEAGLTRTRSILSRHRIVITYRDSRCSDAHGPLAAIDLYYNKMADVFLGPVCDYAVAPVARYSAFWNVPVITGGALADDFRDKNEYKLLTRMTGSYTQVGECVAQFFGINSWSSYSLIFNANEGARRSVGRTECQMMLSAIVQSLKNSRTTSWSEDILRSLVQASKTDDGEDNSSRNSFSSTHIYSSSTQTSPHQEQSRAAPNSPHNIPRRFFDEKDPPGSQNFTRLLLELAQNSRVILVCANLTSVREIMISAAILHLHKGDYAFVLIDLFSSLSKLKRFWYDPDDSERRNDLARSGVEALKIITLRIRTSIEPMSGGPRDDGAPGNAIPHGLSGSKSDPTDLNAWKNARHVTHNEPNGFELAFHDALILYSLAVNETLEGGGQWFNGSEVNRRMWNRSFQGIMGNVKIDQNGDRLADYSLLDMNRHGDFEEAASYYGAEQMFRLLPGKHLVWAGNRSGPPLDTPLCGFDGSLCLAEEFPVYPIAIAILSVALVVTVSAGFLLWKYYDTEAKIAEVYWRVKFDERRDSTCSRVSEIVTGSNPSSAKNTHAMYYKSEVVSTKAVHVPLVITRELRLEFKKMKDLKNDHLTRFIGVSIDPPTPFIVSEFCTRGSLHSLLLNSQMKLDNMFKFSLIQDLIKGISYLHSSYLRYHGNLKSTNCEVDSRFVLKITDYGLHRLRQELPSKSPFCGPTSDRIDLWKAPEVMRSVLKDGDSEHLPVEKKQKADVYSFAIICQEIIVQKGTFWIQNASAKNLNREDICKEILRGGSTPIRPTLQLPEIHFRDDLLTPELFDVIVKCWSEDADTRPDFTFLKLFVQKIIRSSRYSGNLIENLLSRMEQYASNLEQLVEQKTADWMMEKKIAEDLLFAMLPKSVALKRMRNEAVEPERYDSVSIYFSDIVGFTTLTESSTPLQIVTVLNDLYTLFDRIIDDFEVYKVETIGDAYVVASGVPIRNGIMHSREIARMALSLLHSIKSFTIRHRPHENLLLRIGIHSGNVCACMVGEKMPHYTLVGDTVNTASRMESNGKALKIHVSSDFKNLLDNFKTFQLEERGPIVLKGKKEPMIAWWLVGDSDFESYIPQIASE